jgi:hypothetical protein
VIYTILTVAAVAITLWISHRHDRKLGLVSLCVY